jgi:hypothetical protein
MARRRQFNGICSDLLDTFVSRYNDLNGYWALGQYKTFLLEADQSKIIFKLRDGVSFPDDAGFERTAAYYHSAVLRMMAAQAMPRDWLVDAELAFELISSTHALCRVEIISDHGQVYGKERIIEVRQHDPDQEHRRLDGFGPSNQKGII